MGDLGKTWAPVLLGAGLWVFAWMYAQLPPPGEAVAAFRMESRPASSAGPAAGDAGQAGVRARAKQRENPVSDANTLPARDDPGLARGSRRETEDILSVPPVASIDLTGDWKPITLTMPPLVGSPSVRSEPRVPSDRGTATISVFLTPHKPIDQWMLGAGPIVQAPAIGGKTSGSDAWRVGAAFVVDQPADPIVAGALANTVTPTGGSSGLGVRGYGLFTVTPSAHYSFGDGWFVSGAPSFADDKLPDGTDWTLPVGAQVGRMIKIDGKLPVDLLVGVYYDALRPQFGSRWQLRTGAAFVF